MSRERKRKNKIKESEMYSYPLMDPTTQVTDLPKDTFDHIASYLSLPELLNLLTTNHYLANINREKQKNTYEGYLHSEVTVKDSKNRFPYYYLSQYQRRLDSAIQALEAIKSGHLKSDLSFADLTAFKDNNGKDLAWWMRNLYRKKGIYAHFKNVLDKLYLENNQDRNEAKKIKSIVICDQQEVIGQIIKEGSELQRIHLLAAACSGGEIGLVENLLNLLKLPPEDIQKTFIHTCMEGHADLAAYFFRYEFIDINAKVAGKPLIDVVARANYFALSQLLLEKGARYYVDSKQPSVWLSRGHIGGMLAVGSPLNRADYATYSSSVDPLKNNLIIRAMLIERINRIIKDNPKLKTNTVNDLLKALENGKRVAGIKGVQYLADELEVIYKKALSLPANNLIFAEFKKEAWLRMNFSRQQNSSPKPDESKEGNSNSPDSTLKLD